MRTFNWFMGLSTFVHTYVRTYIPRISKIIICCLIGSPQRFNKSKVLMHALEGSQPEDYIIEFRSLKPNIALEHTVCTH